METLNKKLVAKPERKIKIMQFGEGNFLRAFVDWIIQDLNDKGAIDAGVAVVQPMPFGRVAELAAQDGLYTVRLEGIDNGKKVKTSRVIDVIGDCINPFTEYEKFLSYGESEDLQVIVSNTTEAGIAVDPTDTDFTVCPKSYPGKLLALLKRRYDFFKGSMKRGLAIIPCELIDDNGDELKKCLVELAQIKKMTPKFITWLQTANHFTSTLVDRIVPGYPKNEIEAIQEETGYIDNNVVKGEIFHLWVLKKEPFIQSIFPADSTGLNVIFADDIHPYKQRKVKILNGSHTAMVPVAYLSGIDTVGEAVSDHTIGKFIRGFIFDEVNPTIKLPEDQMIAFANSVIERYKNPYIRHELMSIALNSTTKFKTRLLPTLTDYVKLKKALPQRLLFAFAALVVFHKGKRGDEVIALKDDEVYLQKWAKLWADFDGDYKKLAKAVLGWKEAWDMDMNKIHPEITNTVAGYLEAIETKGMRKAVEDVVIQKKTIIINPADNVAVALTDLKTGEVHEGVKLINDVTKGHKFALTDIFAGDQVIKYGNPIARATTTIYAGAHVHTHNARTNLSENLEYTYEKVPTDIPEVKNRKVNVYKRKNGEVGIRNELWIIPTVGCVNGQAKQIVETFKKEYGTDGFDGVFAFTHPYGCSQLGDDHERTKLILQKMVKHPNAGGVLVLGLGCENNQMSAFRATLGEVDETRVKFLVCQEEEDEIAKGVSLLAEIAEEMKKDERKPVNISCLKVGLKCGGSDGLSGITANPLVGRFSDYIVAAGGTTVLSEVPEMFGAEQLLMNRAKDEATFKKVVKLINSFKDYFRANGQTVYENPSPGNKAGGITTLEDKSLGCTQKSGSGPVEDVVFDDGFVTQKGLNLLNGPGNDMCAVTNLAAAGCHLVLFTTGRGTPFGGFVPTVKIATNDELAEKKSNWIDFNAGAVLDTGFDVQLKKLIDLVADVASGAPTKNEINETREIAIFKTGVTL